jgi:hypothetical protein
MRATFCWTAISRFGSKRKKTIPENGQAHFRKYLWLIPFILAKKLLTEADNNANGRQNDLSQKFGG